MSQSLRARTVFALALLVGLGVRGMLAARPGHTDLEVFRRWGMFAAEHPIATIWRADECDYMPAYPAMLGWFVRAHRAIAHPSSLTPPDWLLKLPVILGDVATALALFWIGRFIAGEWIASLVASIHFLNLGMILDGVAWGQVDVFHSLFVLLAFAFSHLGSARRDGWHHAAWASMTVAILFKLQAIVFVPLLLLTSTLGRRPRAVAVSAIAVVGLSILAFAPILVAGELGTFWREVIATASGRYPRLTMAALNVWWLVPEPVRAVVVDSSPAFFGIAYRTIGLTLFSLAYALAIVSVVRMRKDLGVSARPIFLAASFVAVAFFMLPTQMHERYLYPALPLLAVVALFREGRGPMLYVLFSVTLAANLAVPFLRHGLPAIGDWTLFLGSALVVLLNVAGLLALAIAVSRLGRLKSLSQ